METCSCVFHLETREGPSPAVILSIPKYATHDWQAVWKDPNHREPKHSKLARAPAQWEVWFRLKHSTGMQLAPLIQSASRKFDKNRLTCAVFLDVSKAFDTVLVDSMLYKLTVLNFTSYLVKSVPSYLLDRTFKVSFQTATSICRCMFAGVSSWWKSFPHPIQFYVNDMPLPSCHI
jgi:hypothetical protein